MAKQKKPVHRVEMTEGKRNIIRQLLEEYDIETAEDIQDALKDLLEYSARDCAPQPLKLSIHSGGIEHPCRCR